MRTLDTSKWDAMATQQEAGIERADRARKEAQKNLEGKIVAQASTKLRATSEPFISTTKSNDRSVDEHIQNDYVNSKLDSGKSIFWDNSTYSKYGELSAIRKTTSNFSDPGSASPKTLSSVPPSKPTLASEVSTTKISSKSTVWNLSAPVWTPKPSPDVSLPSHSTKIATSPATLQALSASTTKSKKAIPVIKSPEFPTKENGTPASAKVSTRQSVPGRRGKRKGRKNRIGGKRNVGDEGKAVSECQNEEGNVHGHNGPANVDPESQCLTEG